MESSLDKRAHSSSIRKEAECTIARVGYVLRKIGILRERFLGRPAPELGKHHEEIAQILRAAMLVLGDQGLMNLLAGTHADHFHLALGREKLDEVRYARAL